MKKQFTILLILIFVFLIAISFSIAKAIEKHAITYTEFRNEISSGYHKRQLIPYKQPHFGDSFLNQTKDKKVVEIIIKNIIEFIANIIEFIAKNVLGIVFLVWACISINKAIYNYTIKNKYKRDNKRFKAMRCEEEINIGDANNIYLVNEVEKKYYYITDMYTLAELGYARPSKPDRDKNNKDCTFSKTGYTLEGNIRIYIIAFDFTKFNN